MEPLSATDPRMAGEFQLRAGLGAGGMGRVYLGFSPAGRAVAVKIVQPGLARNEAFLARFRQEVTAVRAVSGFYTAPVVAAGPDDHPPWLATAFVPGPALDQLIAAQGPLPEPVLWRLLAGLVEALRAVHGSGVVHRDLKPSNVLLATDGPRLIDFGISRAAESTALTSTGEVFGTPGFMSPEQAEGMRAGPASDVFSLGCVLAYAATGVQPFGGSSVASMLYRIVHSQPTLDGMPARLREVAARCLAKDPAARPALPALAAAIAEGSQGPGPSPASFWPDPVGPLVASYQARLEARLQALPVSPVPGPQAPVSGSVPLWPHQATVTASRAHHRPAGPGPGFPPPAFPGAGTRPPRPAWGISRRRLLALGAVSGASALSVAGWRLSVARPGPASTQRGTEVWTFAASQEVQSEVAVANGVVYAGSNDRHIYALDAVTGGKRWDYRASDEIQTGPVVSGGVVYGASQDGDVYALNAATGQLIWRFSTGGAASPIWSIAVPGNGLVLVPGILNTVYVLDASTGSVRRHLDTSSDLNGDAAVGGGMVYVCDIAGSITAFREHDGTIAWQKAVARSGLQPMTLAGGTVYLGDSAGTLHALDAATGRTRWTAVTPGMIQEAPAAGGGMVGVVSGSYLYAFKASDGGFGWKSYTGWNYARPAASDDVFYVGGFSAFYAIDASTGRRAWAYSGDFGDVSSSAAVANGKVYFGDGAGNITALRA